MSVEHLSLVLLAVALLVMAAINVFALMKLMPLIDSEDKGIHEIKQIAETTHDLLQRLIGKIESMAKVPDESSAWIDQLDAPLQQISPDALDGIDESMAAAEGLLGDLDGLTADQWAEWQAANQLQIRALMKTQEAQRRRLAALRMELDQARGTILNLRSGASRGAQGALQAASLQAKNTTVEAELWSLKAERGRLQRDLKQMEKELQTLQAQTGGGTSDGGDDDLLARYQALEARIEELTDSNARLQALHDRTIKEKQFVEEAFIKLDEQLGLGNSLKQPD